MKKKLLLFAGALLTLSVSAQPMAAQPLASGYRKLENNVFQAGEYLEYGVNYGMVSAGVARIEVLPTMENIHGRECYHVVSQGITSKSFSMFFRVNDRYETWIDKDALCSHKFIRKIEEGNFHSYTETEFDQTKGKAYERHNKKPLATYEVPPFIQDVVSAFYYARTQKYDDAVPGKIYKFQNFIDRKVYDLDVQFIGREVIKVGDYKYRCVKLKPLVREGGLFKHEGDMYLWISDDENRIPMRVETGLVIGAVSIDFVKAKNLKHPMTCRVR
jgi:hypothetical protein